MKESLREMTCLVQVNTANMDWPILYANQVFSNFTDVQVSPPQHATGIDKPFCPDSLQDPPCLWEHLALDASAGGESAFLQTVRNAWEAQPQPHTFGLMADLITVPMDASRGDGKETLRQVSCRFVPLHEPLDVAAAAVSAMPAVKTLKAATYSENKVPESYLYFVLIAMVDGLRQDEAAAASAAEDACGTAEQSTTAGGGHRDSGRDSWADKKTGDSEPSGENEKSKAAGTAAGKQIDGQVQLKPTRSPFVDVKLDRKVGQGSFGKVYFGRWLGSPVAVKVVEWSGARSKIEPLFEAELSCTLSHPNLVQTYKYSTREKQDKSEKSQKSRKLSDGDEVCYQTWIVQEWCDEGTLGMLCSRPRNDTKGYIEALQILTEIASGGSYLHSRGIIHGDLTANNVLCKTQVSVKGYVCKICDFGLARILEGENTGILTNQLGTVTHMPPELFQMDIQLELTTKADVYAAGVLLWQAVCGEFPFKGVAAPVVVVQVASGKRLHMPLDTPEFITSIFSDCTAEQPSDRPNMDQLAERLSEALQQLEDVAGGSCGESVSSA